MEERREELSSELEYRAGEMNETTIATFSS